MLGTLLIIFLVTKYKVRDKIEDRLQKYKIREKMQENHRVVVLAAVAIFACSSILMRNAYLYLSRTYMNEHNQSPRTLHSRSIRYIDPSFRHNNNTISIYLVDGRINPAYSIFQTDVLDRYGSGRFDFRIREHHSQCDRSCATRPLVDDGGGPCIVASRANDCPIKYLRCNYPRCKTMVVGDETCRIYSHDVRGYYTSMLPKKAYLPLGPRLDWWKSFRKIQSSPEPRAKRASERRYAFNAIFSKSTNTGRSQLAKVIEERRDDYADLPIFTTMTEKHQRDVNNPRTKQLNTHDTNEVMLDSVFTLSTAGHNPECYRLFESAEAGSIPVLVKGDLYIKKKQQHRCLGALERWYEAPILVLDSWSDLFPTVMRLMDDPAALDAMQDDLRVWYERHMRRVVAEFEDFMLESYIKERAESDSSSIHKDV